MPYAVDEEKLSKAQSLDLGAPPVKSIPFAEFPKMVYDLKRSKPGRIVARVVNSHDVEEHIEPKLVTKLVNDKKELDAALKAGYSEKAPALYESQEPASAE